MYDFEAEKEDVADLRELLGQELFDAIESAAGSRLASSLHEAMSVLGTLTLQSDREEQARKILEHLIPTNVDVSLWRDVALGENIHLPAIDQYGPLETRLAPPRGSRAERAKKGRPKRASGNEDEALPYGRVHSKGDQEPSAFLRRQGGVYRGCVKRVAEAEVQLEKAREDLAAIEHGLKVYAATQLCTELRNAVAPIFAMGPAWTLLRAIAGNTGEEQTASDQKRETQKIQVTLHALRDDAEFLRAAKKALLQVAHRFEGAARERGKGPDPWAGPYDYDAILSQLDWPTPTS